MRYKKLKFSILLLLGLGITGVQSQNLYVKEISGTQTSYPLSSIQKISFSSGKTYIYKTDNSTETYSINGIRYLSFIEDESGIQEQKSIVNNRLIVFPNPTKDVLHIDLTNVENGGILSIYSMDGKLLQDQKINEAQIISLNLNHLSPGIYLCRYLSGTEIKTVKISKH